MQQTREEPQPAPVEAPPPAPPQYPLDQRWKSRFGDSAAIAGLLSRIRGKALRKRVREGTGSADSMKTAVFRLATGRAYTNQARVQMSAVYGYRRAGGVSFETRWERDLWKRLTVHQDKGKQVVGAISDADLAGAQRSLAGQIAKAWFYLRGIRAHKARAREIRVLYEQILSRRQTENKLDRTDRESVMATRKQLARADAQFKQLARAEALAGKALAALTGGHSTRTDLAGTSVKPLPGDLASSVLHHRPDLARAGSELAEAWGSEIPGQVVALPELILTTGGDRSSAGLKRWVKLKPPAVMEQLRVESSAANKDQREALTRFAETLLAALKEVDASLKSTRQLLVQRSNQEAERQKYRRATNNLRARYSARRADLADILNEQIRLAEAEGKLAYVQNRIFGQRLDSYLALGGSGFSSAE